MLPEKFNEVQKGILQLNGVKHCDDHSELKHFAQDWLALQKAKDIVERIKVSAGTYHSHCPKAYVPC